MHGWPRSSMYRRLSFSFSALLYVDFILRLIPLDGKMSTRSSKFTYYLLVSPKRKNSFSPESLATVLELSLMSLPWLNCPWLNQSSGQGMECSNWPGPGHMEAASSTKPYNWKWEWFPPEYCDASIRRNGWKKQNYNIDDTSTSSIHCSLLTANSTFPPSS